METLFVIMANDGVKLLGEKILSVAEEAWGSRVARKAARELVEQWLSFFKAYVGDHKNIDQIHISLMSQDLVGKVQDIIFDIEDALDEFMFDVPHHIHTTQIRKALHEIGHSATYRSAFAELTCVAEGIKQRISNLKEQGDFIPQRAEEKRRGLEQVPLTHEIVREDEMVGFDKPRDSLLKQLMMNTDVAAVPKLATILVVGPGGSGKTFLVKGVYHDKQIDGQFDCHAWISVSRSFKMESLFLEMRRQFCLPDHHDQPVLTKMEFQFLEKKRYLLVLDDVWSSNVYIRFANALPNGSNSSRIIVTSRKNDIVRADPDIYIHVLGGGLDEEEAWKLFCGKAGGSACIPDQSLSLCKKMVSRCEGLPLAIAAVGSKLPKKQLEWSTYYNSIGSELRVVAESILQPSIFDLPENLRSCFFYWSAFPEGEPVKRGRLIRSWIAEGFVQKKQGLTLEEVAETYLNDLIERNLVQVSEKEIDGRVKSCRVSKLLHEHLVSLSEKGRFLTTISKSNIEASSGERVRRLSVSVHERDLTWMFKGDNFSQVRTLFMFLKQKNDPSSSSAPSTSRSTENANEYSLGSASPKFKLLKVLDLQGTPLKELSRDVGRLVLLRCLNLRGTKIKFVPRSIENLVFLETLNMKHTLVTNLPKGISKLHKLRHLLVSCNDGKEKGVEVSAAAIASLSSLQELSLIKVNNHKKLITKLVNLVELRKLRLVDLNKECEMELCKSIEKMKSLHKLEVRAKTEEVIGLNPNWQEPSPIQCLYLKGRLEGLQGWISKLQSLVKLSLRGSKLSSNYEKPFEAFEALPILMELELVEYYTGKKLIFKAGKFMKLKILHIEEFPKLTVVVVENNAMPNLQKLTICKCYEFKSVVKRDSAGSQPQIQVYDCEQQIRQEGNDEIFDGQELVPLLSGFR